MTKHPNFPSGEGGNILDFPNTRNASLPGEHVAYDDHMPDGIPEGFTLHHDGVYQLRPGEGDDLVPVKICSPLIVNGRCRNAVGRGWGRVLAVQDPDGEWHELVLDTQQFTKSVNVALVTCH